MTMEEWKDIKGYEGKYLASNKGRIKSLLLGRERILSQGLNKYGYYHVVLCYDGKVKSYRVNRLIAQSFIPNPDNKTDVNHKNGIKTDNRVENLEWTTSSENQFHAWRIGLRKPGGGQDRSKKVIDMETGKLYKSGKDAAMALGINYITLISMLCGRRLNKTTLKYV